MSGRLWFRAKRYGWGWTPATWEGWAVMAVYVVIVIAWEIYLARDQQAFVGQPISAIAWRAAVPPIVSTAILVPTCWIKGERPRWRWGK
jgi:hypothetical protein